MFLLAHFAARFCELLGREINASLFGNPLGDLMYVQIGFLCAGFLNVFSLFVWQRYNTTFSFQLLLLANLRNILGNEDVAYFHADVSNVLICFLTISSLVCCFMVCWA